MADIPYLEQYAGVWAIEEGVFRLGMERALQLDVEVHLQSEAAAAAVARGSQRGLADHQISSQGVATIEIFGTLMKQVSSMSRGTSTVLARQQLRAALNDERVQAILLHIDSPGGTVAGTKELADDVAAVAKKKPVYAYIEDLGASAAYWVASQASQVFSNEMALVGSIGTYMAVQDLSGYAAKEGVKVHVIKAGAFKGAGQPGTEITPEQLAQWQRVVDGLNSHFVASVAAGRKLGLAAVRALADGRVHQGAEAQALGLIDGVQSFDQTLAQLSKISKGKAKMSTETTPAAAAPVPATYAELKAGLVGADAAFLVSQLDASATLPAAVSAWMAEQNSRIQAANAKVTQAQAAAAKPGVDPVKTEQKAAASEATDPKAQWSAAVAEKVAAGLPRAKAIAAVVKAQPELHQAYIEACNTR